MIGHKYKIAHKRADKEKWSVTEKTQKKKLITILKGLIQELEEEAALPEVAKKKVKALEEEPIEVF